MRVVEIPTYYVHTYSWWAMGTQSHPHLFHLFDIVGREPSPCEVSKVSPPPSTVVLLNIGNESSLAEGEFVRVSRVVVIQCTHSDCVGLLQGEGRLPLPSIYFAVKRQSLQLLLVDLLRRTGELHCRDFTIYLRTYVTRPPQSYTQ